FVAHKGLYTAADADLRAVLPGPLLHGSSRLLASALVGFVAEQSAKARPGERLVGSTEVLESGFAKLKNLEKGQARGGFTGLVLGWGAVPDRYKYTGREWDSVTQLQYSRARWYNPATGKWLSQDPLGLAPDTNPYRYVGNSPTNATDPSGEIPAWLQGGLKF